MPAANLSHVPPRHDWPGHAATMSEAGITEKIYEPTKLAAVVDLLAGQEFRPARFCRTSTCRRTRCTRRKR